MEIPIFTNPFFPPNYVDPRWARPYVFHDVTRYPFAESSDVQNDFVTLVDYTNASQKQSKMDRYKDGLLKTIDNHIPRCGRLLFCDLLLYVDSLAYLCYASDLMTEQQIINNYASWVKFVVGARRTYIKSSTRWGATDYSGSDNEQDLQSCF